MPKSNSTDAVRPLPHPLDPLGAAEIETAVAIVRRAGGLDDTAWVETVGTAEPEKADLANPKLQWRKAHVCFYERSSGRTFEGVADLLAGTLESFAHVPGAQARISIDEFVEAGKMAEIGRASCRERV